MADDHVIDIRRFLGGSPERLDEGAFAVWGGEGGRSRLALPLWRSIFLVGGDWGGIVSLSKLESEDVAHPLFILDLKQDPARTFSPTKPLRLLQGEEGPALVFTEEKELAVLLGEDEERWWFLQVRGGTMVGPADGKARETLLFLAGECAGLLFFRELATLLPSTVLTP